MIRKGQALWVGKNDVAAQNRFINRVFELAE
jgi:hypothetical protein